MGRIMGRLGDHMNDDTLSFCVSLFHSLAHPTRLRIVEMLTEKERTVGDLAAALGLLQPNVSQHLAILSRAGVIKATPEGAARCYALRGPRIARVLALADEFRRAHSADIAAAPAAPPGERGGR